MADRQSGAGRIGRWDGDDVSLDWMERGGPKVETVQQRHGLESKLVERSMAQQLGGAIDYDWSQGGLVATVLLKRSNLNR